MNDILKSINLRLNNPFILSFCISWIFWNWPIVVGLIWYNSATIGKFGYENYKDLINENANPWRNYVWPATFALAYPFVKWFFSWIQTWVGSKEEKTIKVVSGKGYIPTFKYIDVVTSYDDQIKTLSNIIEKEGTTEKLLSETKTNLLEKEKKIDTLDFELKDIKKEEEQQRYFSDVNLIFKGEWEIKITNSVGGTILFEETYDLNKGEGHNSEKFRIYGTGARTFFINFYIYNPFNHKVAIGFEEREQLKKFVFHDATWNEDYSILKGTDIYSNPTKKLEMSRKKKVS